jgi:hypothetical protein
MPNGAIVLSIWLVALPKIYLSCQDNHDQKFILSRKSRHKLHALLAGCLYLHNLGCLPWNIVNVLKEWY